MNPSFAVIVWSPFRGARNQKSEFRGWNEIKNFFDLRVFLLTPDYWLLATAFLLPYFDCDIRTHLGAERAPGAGPLVAAVLHGIVTAPVERRSDPQELLRARQGAQLAALAVFDVNDNLAHKESPGTKFRVQSSM
jgi:hypothetical protein